MLNSSRVLGGQKEGRPSFALLSTIYAGMQSVGNTANAATRAEKNVEGTNLAPCLFAEIMECQICSGVCLYLLHEHGENIINPTTIAIFMETVP